MANRELNAKYKGSFLGIIWSMLNPLLNLVVYSLVFSIFLRVTIPYFSLFLLSGLLPWTFFQQSIQTSGVSLISYSNLVKKVSFPREIVPLSVVISGYINFLIGLFVLLIISALFRNPMHITWLYTPIVSIPLIFITASMSLLFASVTVYFRDLEHLTSVLLFAWFYITPIVYSKNMVPNKFQIILKINPLESYIVQFQRILYYGLSPQWRIVFFQMIVGIILLLLSQKIFRKVIKHAAEVL